ncbi:MAG: uvrA [Verrucomicrobiales bacterium]|nr:uvrA [Verrucomicrobiales bacterium]
MSKKPAQKFIRLRGVRHNNLKNFDIDFPLNQLIVVTGLSGSGKSSLAFDTLFAEGQRRYIETFSPYARQFFDRMDKPQVDSIEGIPPAIAIEQRNSVKTTRSTVGTMTEVCDYAKVIWANLGKLFCKKCGQLVRKDSPRDVWETLRNSQAATKNSEILITFQIPLSEKLSLDESLALIAKQGYQRLLIGQEVVRLDESAEQLRKLKPVSLTVVQDRAKILTEERKRFVEACEQAYHFGKGKLTVWELDRAASGLIFHAPRSFSNRFHCSTCDIDYREPSPALFSFNHPVGACPTCRGFGRVITIDYNIAVPDRSKTLAELVKPWQSGQGAECQQDLAKFCRARKVRMDVPFPELPADVQKWVIDGDPGYGSDAAHQWPKAWYGVKGYFRWLESKAYKMHVRVLLARYRSYQMCPDCRGARFQPETLLYKLSANSNGGITLAQFYQYSIRDALSFAEVLGRSRKDKKANDPLSLALHEVCARLGYLNGVGLGYLTLDRPTRTLSGGETERVNLTTCLGSGLVNTLFVLDEPSVGLHPRDTDRLIQIVQRLRDAGNTLVVVEHEPSVMRSADQIIDLGPGHGESGGQLVFQGSYKDILKANSLTGEYLSGRKRIEIPVRREVNGKTPRLMLSNATLHNLKNVSVDIPLGTFVCITGVSGSGKTTLVREILLPALEAKLRSSEGGAQKSEDSAEESSDDAETPDARLAAFGVSGHEHLGRLVLVDQSPAGRRPRSNPAVYIGAFEDIRELFALTEVARQRGMKASAFSFNSGQGQCERCRGAGFEKIEMQFLSDVFIRCPECNGRRYRPHVLEIKLSAPLDPKKSWSIADLLEATVDDALLFLSGFDSRHASKAKEKLQLLQEVGLGYLRLGQPVNTLSGGESQRLKLVSHLAEFEISSPKTQRKETTPDAAPKSTLFLFDEPTTGLHFEDVRVLLKVFQRLVDAGHSVVVIEHNLDVIKSADWLIDLGPDAGDRGGQVVVTGPPETVARCAGSHTGVALRGLL